MVLRVGGILAVSALVSCSSTTLDDVAKRQSEALLLRGARAEISGNTMPKILARSVDRHRATKGYQPLIFDERIAQHAHRHSVYMMKRYIKTGSPTLSHKGSKGRFNIIMLDYAMSQTAENVAYCSKRDRPLEALKNLWKASGQHEGNMLNNWTHTGVGVAVAPDGAVFATQIFALKTDYTF